MSTLNATAAKARCVAQRTSLERAFGAGHMSLEAARRMNKQRRSRDAENAGCLPPPTPRHCPPRNPSLGPAPEVADP